jgi:hypothetical protein
VIYCRSFRSGTRGVRVVTNVGRNAVDVKVLSDVRHRRGRRNRVVPTPRRWRQVSRRLQRPATRRWWQSSIGSPRRARISRKPLRREGRSVSACTCGFRARANLLCAGAPGAAATRSSLRPPYSRRVTDDAKLGRNPPRERETVSAIFSWFILRDAAEFIIGPRLARTRWQLLRMRRNAWCRLRPSW